MSGELIRVDTGTGEVLPFDPKTYLAALDVETQRKMNAAYDAACKSLIGENDVQREGGREFKKKSAWRKLARHFGISTAVVSISHGYVGDVFLATVTVKASGPWGQSSDAVGACATDEATGRRVITIADAIATAETRATNRAVSNLIAMGEVTAEEIGDRKSYTAPPRASANPTGGPTLPFGKSKGKALAEMDTNDLSGALKWAQEKAAGKFTQFEADASDELDSRRLGAGDGEPGFPDFERVQ